MAIPLCLPNNCRWDAAKGRCSKTGEERSSLVIVDEALRKLRTLKGPVCVVSITGPYRKGKSYILSEVFDQPAVFPLGHSLGAETMGIWMWIVPGKFQDSNGQECSIVLLDSEGINAVGGEGSDDNQIFTLSVLLSSVLIYNSSGVPERQNLAGLEFIAKLSHRVKLRSSNEGQEGVEARHDDAKFFHKTFPFFIWLLRDVTLRPPSDCKDIKEYFLKRLFQDQSESNGGSVQKVAESILCFFSGFDAFQLPPPSSDPEVLEDMTSNKDKLTSAFLNGVEKLKSLLKSVLVTKQSFNDGDIVTGEGLAALVSLYVDAINSPGMIPNVQTAWETFVTTKCLEARQASFHLYKETMTAKLSGELPCDNDVIREKHVMALEKGLAHYEKETFEIAATTTEKYRNEMMTCCDEALQSWLLENEALTRQACDALLKNLKKEHLDSLTDRLLEQGGAEVSFDDIIQGFERIKQDFDARAKGAKDVCATMFFEFHPTLMKEIQGNLRILHRQKDFDERKSQEIAARAYQEQEVMKLKEQSAQLLQEIRERQLEMEKQQRKFKEEKERLQQKMAADANAQQEQATNMIKASMQKAE
ncbi:PREDICTED: guanylate-binding protein 6-like isoform X3 [Acropora digitifera]|uniref:guanylate-binding protein 6-like isoform X3 n=1 Tax=Acropora digitifera TaxID=70779 RepID=UPI00077AEC08|nr:PREDICTED: guanylate-binding protein 6-like isoform X3 [Acropora digitifera]XP_015752496.1 PREDICTED: guanylate-binding protein 6-like isoform X3 [Acropora digitifera]